MRQLDQHPFRSLGGLLVLAFVLFMLSASGQPGTYWSDGPGWLGEICWFAWMIAFLAFVGAGITTLVRRLSGRRSAA